MKTKNQKTINKNQKPTKKKRVNTLTTKHLPVKVQAVKNKSLKNTTEYYQCLADTWRQGKITSCCSKCKKNAGALSSLRTAEIRKLGEAYRQVGVSLTTLLQPLKPAKH